MVPVLAFMTCPVRCVGSISSEVSHFYFSSHSVLSKDLKQRIGIKVATKVAHLCKLAKNMAV